MAKTWVSILLKIWL